MADIDIDPFGEHESRPEEPTDEHIPLDPVTPGRSTWEPEHEQETSFGDRSRTSVLHKENLVGEIYELIGNKTHQRLEPNLSLFKLGEDGRLYYKGETSNEHKWRAKNDWCHWESEDFKRWVTTYPKLT